MRKNFLTKVMAFALATAIVVGLCPNGVLAATGSEVAADGTYSKTANVVNDPQYNVWEDEWDGYDITVNLEVADGKYSSVTIDYEESSAKKYVTWATSEAEEALLDKAATEDTINAWEIAVDACSGATCTCDAVKKAALAAIQEAPVAGAGSEGVPEEKPDETPEEATGYVLMNIPYDEFFAAEGIEGVDAVSTATVKTYNQNMAAGSYHEGYAAADPITDAKILGVTYPVYVEDMSVLEGLTCVTDEDTATISVAAGKKNLTEAEVSGADLLFASGDYAYYVMNEAPNNYKTLVVDGDNFTFTNVDANAVEKEGMEVEMVYGAHYTDIEFNITVAEITDTTVVNAITLTDSEGAEYALRHVENIWRKTSLGWNWEDLDGAGLAGKTIDKVTLYLEDNGVYGIYEYDVNETVKLNPGEITAEFEDVNTIAVTGLPSDIQNAKATVATKVGRGETATVIAENVDVVDGKIVTTVAAEAGTYTITVVSDNYGDVSTTAQIIIPGYVLMNIPYDEFFAAEGVEGVDAVSTATVKTYNQNMAAGSYHEGYAAADPITDAKILGVTYPVYVEDLALLKGYTRVTDEDTATISVAAGKKNLTEAEVSGADLLFASGDYAYYVMNEAPNNYKTLVVDGDNFTFTNVDANAVEKEGMEVEMVYGAHYTDIEFNITVAEITDTTVVNAITLTDSEGTEYALRHVENIWRKTSLGWNWEDLDGAGLAGKTIDKATLYLEDNGVYGIYEYDVNETVKLNPGEITAEFEDVNTIAVTGLPSDIQNAKATVATKVGRGETATVIAENVDVVDGKIVTTVAAEAGTYTITVVSDNYGDVSTTADFGVVEEPTVPEKPAEPGDTSDDKAEEAPKTGDMTNVIGYTGMLAVSAVLGICTLKNRKKEDTEE